MKSEKKNGAFLLSFQTAEKEKQSSVWRNFHINDLSLEPNEKLFPFSMQYDAVRWNWRRSIDGELCLEKWYDWKLAKLNLFVGFRLRARVYDRPDSITMCSQLQRKIDRPGKKTNNNINNEEVTTKQKIKKINFGPMLDVLYIYGVDNNNNNRLMFLWWTKRRKKKHTK